MRTRAVGLLLLSTVCMPAAASSQQAAEQLMSRVNSVRNGTVRLSFAAREGVCGNGTNWSHTRPGSTSWHSASARDIEPSCERGPVRVVVVRDGGVTTDLRVYVGARWRSDSSAVDLGTIAASTAGPWLLALVEDSDPRPARAAMMAATITDSVDAWPALLRIARRESSNAEIRSQALYLLAEYAGDRVTASLDSIAYEPGDRELRRQAIHAMARRPPDEAIPNLIRMAETLPDRELRKLAIHWLGRTRDQRALEHFEKVLR